MGRKKKWGKKQKNNKKSKEILERKMTKWIRSTEGL